MDKMIFIILKFSIRQYIGLDMNEF